MVTWNIWRMTSNVKGSDPVQYLYFGEGDCMSTDEKPVDGIFNGSILSEIDTGNIYKFDQESKSWMLTW